MAQSNSIEGTELVDFERYAQARDLFHQARALSRADREAWLVEACEGDHELQREVQELLEFDFLPLAPDDETPGAEINLVRPTPLPEEIAGYRIDGKLGEGGMGVVYDAFQTRLERRVALKVIRPEFMSPDALRRFEFETRALGRLRHPGIARIYESGTASTAQGEFPYFAMEYVEGQSLQGHPITQSGDVRKKLILIEQLASAVEHAHQRGIVHRDLKPSNIIIDRSGSPHVLDFGVARAIDSEGLNQTLSTGIGQVVGTIPYMSPEQAAGDQDEVDTRSDVYALGAIAFELLTGGLPHELDGLSTLDALRQIREAPHRALSTLDRALSGDVQTVVHTALHPEKASRYASAASFAEDLRRILENEPVLARPSSAFHRGRLFVKRNKVLVAGTAATFITLIAGIVSTSWQARVARDAEALAEARFLEADAARVEAEYRTDDAVAARRFLEGVIQSASPSNQGKDTTVLEALNWAANRLMPTFEKTPSLEASVRSSLGSSYAKLALYEKALEQHRAALTRRREHLPHGHPLLAEAVLNVGTTLQRLRRNDEAVPLLEEAHATLSKNEASRDRLGTALLALAGHSRTQRDFHKAETLGQSAIDILATTRGENDRLYAVALNGLGETLRYQNKAKEAEPYYRRALSILQFNELEDSVNAAAMANNLALTLRSQAKHNEAVKFGEMAVRTGKLKLLESDERRAAFSLNLSRHYLSVEKFDLAEAAALEAQKTWELSSPQGHNRIAPALSALGHIALKRKRPDLAEEHLVKAHQLFEKHRGESHPHTREALHSLSKLRRFQGRTAEANNLLSEARAIANELPKSSWVRADYDCEWARVLIARQDLERAEELLTPAFISLRSTLGIHHPRTIRAKAAVKELCDKMSGPNRLIDLLRPEDEE